MSVRHLFASADDYADAVRDAAWDARRAECSDCGRLRPARALDDEGRCGECRDAADDDTDDISAASAA